MLQIRQKHKDYSTKRKGLIRGLGDRARPPPPLVDRVKPEAFQSRARGGPCFLPISSRGRRWVGGVKLARTPSRRQNNRHVPIPAPPTRLSPSTARVGDSTARPRQSRVHLPLPSLGAPPEHGLHTEHQARDEGADQPFPSRDMTSKAQNPRQRIARDSIPPRIHPLFRSVQTEKRFQDCTG